MSIKRDFVNGWLVSTVQLGSAHGVREGLPLVFETMILNPWSYADRHCERYTSLPEAEGGHQRAVDLAKGMKPPAPAPDPEVEAQALLTKLAKDQSK